MERRGCGLGCIITLLGLTLCCCLLPYLISSVYSVVSAVLQVPGTPDWLWGDWLSSVIGADSPLYIVLAEGPICCVGALGFLIVVLGLVMLISGAGPERESEVEGYEEYTAPDSASYTD